RPPFQKRKRSRRKSRSDPADRPKIKRQLLVTGVRTEGRDPLRLGLRGREFKSIGCWRDMEQKRRRAAAVQGAARLWTAGTCPRFSCTSRSTMERGAPVLDVIVSHSVNPATINDSYGSFIVAVAGSGFTFLPRGQEC